MLGKRAQDYVIFKLYSIILKRLFLLRQLIGHKILAWNTNILKFIENDSSIYLPKLVVYQCHELLQSLLRMYKVEG